MKFINSFFRKYLNTFLLRTKGQKSIFLMAGSFNILLTNILLQFLLITEILSISTSTLTSQIFNMVFGYFIYSKKVFKISKIFKTYLFFKYLTLMIALWQLNKIGIESFIKIGISKSFSAIILIPFLAIISFIFQRFLIFSNPKKYET